MAEDIFIKLQILLAGQENIAKIDQAINQMSQNVSKNLGRITNMSESFTTQLEDNSGQAKILTQDLREMGILGSQSLESIQRQAQAARKNMLFLGLGTLFFGMALQRLFGGIMKTGVDTFRQITEATEGSQSALTGINAGMTFLQFTIGDTINTALEPFLPLILAIIDAFTDFMQQNPWTGWVIIGGVLAGMALLTFGTLTAFMSSIGKTFTGDLTTNVTKFADKLSGIAKLAAAGIGISMVVQGITEFEKDVASGVSKSMEGAGLVLLAGRKTREGAAVYMLGAGLKFAKEAFEKDFIAGLTEFLDEISTLGIWHGIISKNPYTFALGIGFKIIGADNLIKTMQGIFEAPGKLLGGITSDIGKIFGLPQKTPVTSVEDFILQPGGRIIETDPNDTIMGSKNGFGGMGGNTTVNIDARGALFDREGIDKLADVVGNAISSRISNSTSTQTIR